MARFDRIDIVFQTMYSELVQWALGADFASEFSLDGRFVAVDVRGKNTGILTFGRQTVASRSVTMLVPCTTRKLRSALTHSKTLNRMPSGGDGW